MKLKIIVHQAEEGGFWAEVPAIQGCATQGETMEELLVNLRDAVDTCLSVDLETIEISENDKVLELVLWNLFQENTLRGFLKSFVVEHPEKTVIQSDGRIKKWAHIKESGKVLRVILLEDGETVHNAFFDRSYKES